MNPLKKSSAILSYIKMFTNINLLRFVSKSGFINL